MNDAARWSFPAVGESPAGASPCIGNTGPREGLAARAPLPASRLCLALLALIPAALSAADALPGISLPWPGGRTAQPAAAVPPVVFASAPTRHQASGPSPAAIAAKARELPVTGRLGLSPQANASLAIGPHLLRPGDLLPAALLPPGCPPARVHAIARHHWTLRVEPLAQPPWEQDIALPLTLP